MRGSPATPVAGWVGAGGMTDQPSITCPKCQRTSCNPNDIREGYCGNCHDWTGPSQWERAHQGPQPGVYLITVELPPDTDPDKWYALMSAYRNITRFYTTGDIYVHGSRVMRGMGRHASEQ